ncbi:hypothetical protein U9M48_002339 [Paspalum notatum var. saurae]|uniref:Uncharacterized protein n=1 Tax=Paspalum notatum var. saurae TaxID=547442 RepID=A0AAQ3PKT9_PASNO
MSSGCNVAVATVGTASTREPVPRCLPVMERSHTRLKPDLQAESSALPASRRFFRDHAHPRHEPENQEDNPEDPEYLPEENADDQDPGDVEPDNLITMDG